MESARDLPHIIEILRRQQVRQGDLHLVLDCVITQATVLKTLPLPAVVLDTASEMKARALELKRVSLLPKFVVEDLLEESITKLELAQKPAQ